MEDPFPGGADGHGVLSAAFPEELPADPKLRKLGEQGGGTREILRAHICWHLKAKAQRGQATCLRSHS